MQRATGPHWPGARSGGPWGAAATRAATRRRHANSPCGSPRRVTRRTGAPISPPSSRTTIARASIRSARTIPPSASSQRRPTSCAGSRRRAHGLPRRGTDMRLAFLSAALAVAIAASANEVVKLPVRGGVVQAFYLHADEKADPKAVAILLAGGGGEVHLREEKGVVKPRSGNFLVRSGELFADSEVAAAVADTPSDAPGGMSDGFRAGPDHASDIAAVVESLRKRYPRAK